ncbi:MAG: hypothetical protein COV52_03240 [Gammaproteobacteria bacterium CG11_big_fil_rev_8_21_14_0_20_46_22]|nr:MAG: hypothetical protein COW05_00860 [Gammaproteobacteria bacterium CG12_big_fil_rev_8_21_14_0_65_46_12]PIR11559.1 MAG: hypothetical protein COV52_03240 [Gammaproteobacteria bacterium CG11_big_fil_rev_8_21_14_0_20_46_22]
MLILYHCNNSYASQKVRLYFAEKSVLWKEHHIDLLKQEHLTEEYQRINPRALVPALDDNGKIIVGSTNIMKYVSDHYLKEMITLDSTLIGRIYSFCKRDEELHDPHIRTLSYHYLWMDHKKSAEEEQRVLMLARKHPDKARGDFLARAIQRQLTEVEIDLSNKMIIAALDEMEALLAEARSGFLFGEQYTMADAAGTARLFRLELLGFQSDIEKRALVLAYYKTMRDRVSFSKANMTARK